VKKDELNPRSFAFKLPPSSFSAGERLNSHSEHTRKATKRRKAHTFTLSLPGSEIAGHVPVHIFALFHHLSFENSQSDKP
jgi:hypothetical protein